MILWSIQPIEIWNMINETGVYRCDPAKITMYEPGFREKYHWLIRQMKKRVGPPPAGVAYPVWAWHTQDAKHKKPDLRHERWGYGPGNEQYTCIEFEAADSEVLLSDFDAWSVILIDGLLADSDEESGRIDAYYDSLPQRAKRRYKDRNWEKVFDVSYFEDEWMLRGHWIQANVWELRRDMVKDVRFFKTAMRKT